MVYKYTSKNRYFKDVIDDYFKTDWTKYNDINLDYLNYVDVDYPNKSCNKCKIINQFKTIDMLGNKKEQYESIVKYNNGIKPDYMPLTIAFEKDTIQNIKYLFVGNKKWIVKPENSLARNGVTLLNSYEKCEKWVIKHKYKTWIIQDYIDSPLLISGRKFHFRLYVLVIKDSSNISILLYNKGFMYFAKTPYDTNILIHDSNLSGEYNPECVKGFPHNYIQHFGDELYINTIVPQFKKIVKETIMAVYNKIECPDGMADKYRCFKMFGYDVLVDSSHKLHLAEINARLISLKYPPPGFKNDLYRNILDIITLDVLPHNGELTKSSEFLFIDTTPVIKSNRKKTLDKTKLYATLYTIIALLILFFIVVW